MTALLHPGVYVQEIPSGARTIEGAPTGTAIFVGETERGPIGPTRIIGRNDYERIFGGYSRARDGGLAPTPVLMRYAIDGFFANGGSQAYVLRAMNAWDSPALAAATRDSTDPTTPTVIEASSPGIWGNELRATLAASTDGDANRFRIAVFYTAPDDGVERWVEDWDRLSPDPTDENYVVDVLRRSLYIRWFEATAPFVPALEVATTGPTEAELALPAVALAGGVGGGANLPDADFPALFDRLAEVSDAALIVAASDRQLPGLDVSVANDDGYVNFINLFTDYVLLRPLQDLFLVGDLPRLTGALDPVGAAVNHARGTGAALSTASNYNSLYWPHIEIADPIGAGSDATRVIPPAGHVAGLYARTDLRRGVWKAPAGTEATLASVRGLDFDVLDVHQDNLNPQGINALRRIAGAGLVSWGARTRQPSSEWRYVPVRRTAIFLRHSIFNGIQWAVFEPNGEGLWASLRATIGAFMETQFNNGAFAGATSREAYFVKCDGETTPEIDRAAGIVNVLVGFAPLRPAEFVVVKLSQKVALEA